ncbi:hypothetical protein K435DRAFT_970990 [Dendrothele bispora CBS 962.96]|uniref:Uncharacterized protein n=1 Tax=Dendrothele bispora (strain CBS 962.96) TaxID=1314807 RepID=A0A4V4HCV7_DENBC|nr:hypothetical protein K435DRAFT_970990 [Dendrothele bispora CBS 962.96]
MLLLYALAHPLPSLLASTNESLPSPETSLEALNSCSDINSSRTVEKILYSCLAVVFACTWVAIHPNIPRQFMKKFDWDNEEWFTVEIADSFTISSARVFAQDVITMILSLLAPELIILWALRQWFAARRIAEKYSKYGWTKTHGHFLIMGGFALFEDGRYMYTLEDSDGFRAVCRHMVSESDIRNQIEFQNSKGEKTKQPPQEGRPEDYHSQSEDPLHPDNSTQGADAPQSESTPLSGPSGELSEAKCLVEYLIQHKYIDITEDEITARSKTDFLTKFIAVVQTTWFILQCIARVAEGLVVTDLEIVTVAFALLNIATYVLWWNKPQRVRYPVRIDIHCRRHSSRKPAFSSWTLSSLIDSSSSSSSKSEVKVKENGSVKRRVEHGWKSFTDWINGLSTIGVIFLPILPFLYNIFHLSKSEGSYQTGLESDPPSLYLIVISLFLVFGGIHCLPWNSTFPTNMEQLLWRVSAVTVTAFPLVWFLLFEVGLVLDVYTLRRAIKLIYTTIKIVVLFFLPLVYICARITLIVIAFMELQALPPSAYQTVDWARFIPHI